MRQWLAASVLAAVALTGCSDSEDATGQGGEQPVPGPGARTTFLDFARSADFGARNLADATDEQLLSIGEEVCGRLDEGLSWNEMTQELTELEGKPLLSQADVFSRSAVNNLCPQFVEKIP